MGLLDRLRPQPKVQDSDPSMDPQTDQPENNTGPELRLLTSESDPKDQLYLKGVDALKAGAISKEECDAILDAERAYGVARQRFIERFNAIKHEKVRHNSQNLTQVVHEAGAALKEYDIKVELMNSLLKKHQIKERSPFDKSMFDDNDQRIKLDTYMCEVGLESVRRDISQMESPKAESGPRLVEDKTDSNTAA